MIGSWSKFSSSRDSRQALTKPSSMPDGATMSTPARA
jgi:hypothetical protein